VVGAPEPIRVELLTQEQCAFCDQAKRVLDRLAREFPLAVATRDLASTEGRALAEQGGVMFPPGLFVEGEPFSYGRVSERKLRRELRRRVAKG
jgi:glutaredoxin